YGSAVVFTGGADTTVGTLTGLNGSIGTINSPTANIVFASGNLLLNDQITVGGNTVVNSGAALTLGSPLTITGNYSQSAGTLALANGGLMVSGAASITGGAVIASLSSTGNYLAGQVGGTLVQGGAGSNYTGASLLAGTPGIALTPGTIGNALVAMSANDYIGGTQGSLVNTITITGVNTALYVASSGSLGSLSNSGVLNGTIAGIQNLGAMGDVTNNVGGTITGGVNAIVNAGGANMGIIANSGLIAGNVVNLGTGGLIFTGGAGGTVGTLTGLSGSIGTISNPNANIVFAGGNLLLNDQITVGGGNTVVNSGAGLTLGTPLTITGSYSQGAGTLALTNGGLVVTGAASITGGTVIASLSSSGNYLAGQAGQTLVQGGGGSSYAGVTIQTNAISGLVATAVTDSTNLVVQGLNDYIGGTLGGVVNSQTIAGVDTALYVASSGSLGSVSNTGLLSGTSGGVANYGTIGLVTNGAAGTIAGGVNALYNDTNGVIGTLANSGTITANSVG
ncbi:beta strand repeat-containing protein, partial [Nitrospirillum pindoramense]|uniref:beta strand repeat-containing protein n=1 Tax=Nitrospirillum amazonense TaxID=28077 RepID=UPI001B3BC1A8